MKLSVSKVIDSGVRDCRGQSTSESAISHADRGPMLVARARVRIDLIPHNS
jgi:hypothetical protein